MQSVHTLARIETSDLYLGALNVLWWPPEVLAIRRLKAHRI